MYFSLGISKKKGLTVFDISQTNYLFSQSFLGILTFAGTQQSKFDNFVCQEIIIKKISIYCNRELNKLKLLLLLRLI